jgi:hypothetical protein
VAITPSGGAIRTRAARLIIVYSSVKLCSSRLAFFVPERIVNSFL